MSSRKVQSFHGLYFILIVCCFKIGLYQALSTTDRTTEHTSTSQTPDLSSPANITPDSTSDFLTTTAAAVTSATWSGTCDNLGYVHDIGNYAYHNWYVDIYNNDWGNSSFWGGRVQIPWRENMNTNCSKWPYSYFAVLNEKHMDMADIGEDVITAEVCIWNHTDECISNVTVEMRTCNGHLLYRLPWGYDYNVYYDTYVCFDRVYTDSCQSSESVYSAGNVTDGFLNLSYHSIQFGWLDAHQNGKQYVIPAYDDVDEIFDECVGINDWYRDGFFLKGTLIK
ncbi:uncharacterized protein LOC132728104 [Ruditapes philippinarum]|uniref:uncharacterized protein LOC132728104 n=1 Tax=Ruditapes philippinarum TaxID=129788 RepID=UPI00295BB312|nr:uncharacterized protein LOC132728104 [Ruditapes philippinarum]